LILGAAFWCRVQVCVAGANVLTNLPLDRSDASRIVRSSGAISDLIAEAHGRVPALIADEFIRLRAET
jgi:hypothetical protein